MMHQVKACGFSAKRNLLLKSLFAIGTPLVWSLIAGPLLVKHEWHRSIAVDYWFPTLLSTLTLLRYVMSYVALSTFLQQFSRLQNFCIFAAMTLRQVRWFRFQEQIPFYPKLSKFDSFLWNFSRFAARICWQILRNLSQPTLANQRSTFSKGTNHKRCKLWLSIDDPNN